MFGSDRVEHDFTGGKLHPRVVNRRLRRLREKEDNAAVQFQRLTGDVGQQGMVPLHPQSMQRHAR
jgi:hypothetical protein